MQIATVRPGAEVRLAGRLDVTGASDARVALHAAVESGSGDLVVDVAGVELVDATGLGVLVGGLKRVRTHDGSLQLVCTQERLLKIFRITGLTKVFTIHDSVDAALSLQS